MEMKKIVCTYEDYNKYAEVFEHMSFKALEYVPDLETIKKIIVPNLPEYILFLLWIDETGYETKENAKIRRLLKQIIYKNFEIVHSKAGDTE